MIKIGNIQVSPLHEYPRFSSGHYAFGVEFIGWPHPDYVIISLGKNSIGIDCPKRCSKKQVTTSIVRSGTHCKFSRRKGTLLVIFRRAYYHFSLGISHFYHYEERGLNIYIGLYEIEIQWETRLSKKWLKKERREYAEAVQYDLMEEGIFVGTPEYDEQMAKTLKEHDEFMAKSPAERWEETARLYEERGF